MACCLMAPSHYLNQCWFIISEDLCHSPKHYLDQCWFIPSIGTYAIHPKGKSTWMVIKVITTVHLKLHLRTKVMSPWGQWVNTLRPRQDGRLFPDDIFKCIFLNENAWILLEILLKFVPKVQINNIPALVQIMAWRRSGDKPLSEPMMVSLLTHICITLPQWVNQKPISVAVMSCHPPSKIISYAACIFLEQRVTLGCLSEAGVYHMLSIMIKVTDQLDGCFWGFIHPSWCDNSLILSL